MERRAFIRKMAAGFGTAAVPVTAATVAERSHTAIRESTESLKRRLDQAEQKLEKLEAHQKRALKSGVLIAGLLIGVDLSLLI